jgi:hypothetical protein
MAASRAVDHKIMAILVLQNDPFWDSEYNFLSVILFKVGPNKIYADLHAVAAGGGMRAYHEYVSYTSSRFFSYSMFTRAPGCDSAGFAPEL